MNRLKELRINRGLKQTELARQLSITQGALSGWETGRYQIGSDDLIRIARFFNVSTDYVLGLSEDNESVKETPEQIYLQEKLLLELFSILDETDKVRAIDHLVLLTDNKKYNE